MDHLPRLSKPRKETLSMKYDKSLQNPDSLPTVGKYLRRAACLQHSEKCHNYGDMFFCRNGVCFRINSQLIFCGQVTSLVHAIVDFLGIGRNMLEYHGMSSMLVIG